MSTFLEPLWDLLRRRGRNGLVLSVVPHERGWSVTLYLGAKWVRSVVVLPRALWRKKVQR